MTNRKWAQMALALGGLLLAVGAGLAIWDAAAGDPAPPVITGRTG